jgi:hypothetical protein
MAKDDAGATKLEAERNKEPPGGFMTPSRPAKKVTKIAKRISLARAKVWHMGKAQELLLDEVQTVEHRHVAGSRLGGADEVPLVLEGDRGDTEEPPSVAASKPEPAEDEDDSEEEPIVTAMMFRFSIPGAATNTVLGERGGTLSILKSRTGCTALTLGGEPEDKKRTVTVEARSAVVGKNVQRVVRRLVMAQRNGV